MSERDRIRTHRDEALGAALRELEVPEHRPGFEDELRRRLAAERVASLEDARRRRATRRTGLRWGVRVALVAAVAAVLLVAIGIPGSDRTPRIAGPEVASAAEIQGRVRAALARLENLSGVLVFDGPERGDERRWRFVVTAEGDVSLRGPGRGERLTYDASAGVARSAQRSASLGGGPLFFAERRGVAPGPPDQGPPSWVLPDEFGSYVRALLAARDPRVREVVYEGRPAWRLDVDAVRNAIVPEFTGDRFVITVDRETGVPVRVVERQGRAFLRELRIERLAVDRDLPEGTFRLDFPAGADVLRTDEGFRRVELDEVDDVVGYAPHVPARVPDGYRLAEVAVAREGGPTGTEAGNPVSRMVVSLSYRRGLDQFLVTTRLAEAPDDGSGLPPEERWGDPLATGEGFVDERERVTLGAGALRGETAEVVLVPRGIPHLWVLTDELVVTVGGDLGRAELIGVAESLERGP